MTGSAASTASADFFDEFAMDDLHQLSLVEAYAQNPLGINRMETPYMGSPVMVQETYLQDLLLDTAEQSASPDSPAQEAAAVLSTEQWGKGEHCASPLHSEASPGQSLPLAAETLELGQAITGNYKSTVEEVCPQTGDTMENKTDF